MSGIPKLNAGAKKPNTQTKPKTENTNPPGSGGTDYDAMVAQQKAVESQNNSHTKSTDNDISAQFQSIFG